MKKDIDFLLSKVSKVIKGENFLYLVPKKGKNREFLESAMQLRYKKQDSLFFVRCGNRFTFCDRFEGLKFKGLLIYGSLAKLIKNELTIYTFPELKKKVYHKNDAFSLSLDYVDNKLKFSLLKNNMALDLKIFLETGEEKEKQKNEYNIYNQTILDL